jgi:hypothetical protein
MSQYDVQAAIHRLQDLGVDVSTLHQDYYKIPLENIDLQKNELDPPKKSKVLSKHNVIIDSRQRDYSIYPYPNSYLIELMESYRSVERIELIAAMMPKTEYNVNSDNNLLLVTISGVQQALYLTPGQYLIGSNSVTNINYTANGATPVSGLISEVVRVLNTHVNSANGFNVFLASIPGNNNGTGVNASVLNRIIITNTTVNFSIDFTNANYSSGSPYRLLGFLNQKYTSNLNNNYYGSDNLGTCTPNNLQSGTTHTIGIPSISSLFDYDLADDPNYIIMDLEFGNRSADRTEAIDVANNQKFAVIIYDANEPDNIETFNINNTNVQVSVSRKPGRLKALKGSDFDKKIITFDPPITIENFKITFYKYDNTLYDFHNREHLLTFEVDVADYDPKYRY